METNICKIKFRRGIEEGRKGITPEEGEPIFTTDTHRLCIGDGITKGGIPITKVFTDTDTAKPVKGDFKYKNNALYLYTSDDTSVAVGGVDSVKSKIGDGLIVEEDGTIKVQAGKLIDVNNKGVNVSDTLANAVTGIKDMETNISILSSTAMKSPLAPIYDDKTYTLYVNVDGKVNIPVKLDDIDDIKNGINENGVYTFTSNNIALSSAIKDALKLPEAASINFIGINDGCILNCDNSIKFDYTSATYISGYESNITGTGANATTTYTISTYEGIVPRFHVDPLADIPNGSITKDMLSEDLKKQIINIDNIYPVDSIYLSMSNTNPGEIFGGTWEQIKDRFLLAAGDDKTGGKTGGEETHTLTIDEIPSHNHEIKATYTASTPVRTKIYRGGQTDDMITVSDAVQNTGGGQPHNNMPPYLVVYMWRRVK